MMTLLADFNNFHSWGILEWIIALIVIVGAMGILFIVCQVAGIAIPQWVWKILLIVLCCFLAIAAIRFLAGM